MKRIAVVLSLFLVASVYGDIVGSDSLLNEVELIQIIDEVFYKLGIKVSIKLNNRKILAGIAAYIGQPELLTEITVAERQDGGHCPCHDGGGQDQFPEITTKHGCMLLKGRRCAVRSDTAAARRGGRALRRRPS